MCITTILSYGLSSLDSLSARAHQRVPVPHIEHCENTTQTSSSPVTQILPSSTSVFVTNDKHRWIAKDLQILLSRSISPALVSMITIHISALSEIEFCPMI